MSDEPGEGRDSAEPEESVLKAEAGPEAESEYHPFDEVSEEFHPGPAMRVLGADGMPVTVDTTTESDIPALSTETLVCMGDYSKFVLRDRWGRMLTSFEPGEIERMPNGVWTAPAVLVCEKLKLAIERERERARSIYGEGNVKTMAGTVMAPAEQIPDVQWAGSLVAPFGKEIQLDGERFVVEPLRPPCRHYVRQRASFEHNATNKVQLRLCAARRTTEGTFMGLRDTGMWACDMREPYHAESAKLLDTFDEEKVAAGKERQHLPMFQGFGRSIFDTTPQASERDDKEN